MSLHCRWREKVVVGIHPWEASVAVALANTRGSKTTISRKSLVGIRSRALFSSADQNRQSAVRILGIRFSERAQGLIGLPIRRNPRRLFRALLSLTGRVRRNYSPARALSAPCRCGNRGSARVRENYIVVVNGKRNNWTAPHWIGFYRGKLYASWKCPEGVTKMGLGNLTVGWHTSSCCSQGWWRCKSSAQKWSKLKKLTL